VVGVAPCPGPGSRHTPFAIARDLVREACRALVDLGVQRVVFTTFHGAPLHALAIDAGVELLRAKGVHAVAPFNAVTRAMLEADGSAYAEAFEHIENAAEREAMIRDLPQDFHAGFFETSMALQYAPESVAPSYRELAPCPDVAPVAVWRRAAKVAQLAGATTLAKELTLVAHGLGWQALDPFPGYTGRPHRATAKAGAFFARTILDVYEPIVEDVFAGRASSPPPILQWAAKLSLNGRLSPSAAPDALRMM
jgi:creatinine amidohydrolase